MKIFTLVVCAILVLGIAVPVYSGEKEDLLFEDIPIVFAAGKFEQKSTEAAASVVVISAEEIKMFGYNTLEEVLRKVVGLYVTNDRNYSYLGVRGYYIPGDYSSRILISINGLTANDEIFGTGTIGRELGINMDSIKRIEIIKGPGSALYGTHALFCVINIVTKDGEDINGIKFTGQYGDPSLTEGRLSFGKKFKNDLDIFISGSFFDYVGDDLYFEEFDTPENNNGIFEDANWEEAYDFFSKISYKDFSLQGGFNMRDTGIPTSAWGTVFNNDGSKTSDGFDFLEFKYNPKIKETSSLLFRLYHRYYIYDGHFMFEYEDGGGGYYIEDNVDWSRNEWSGLEFQYSWVMSEKNHLIMGTEYQNYNKIHQKNYDAGLLGPDYFWVYLNEDHSMSIWSLYMQDIFKIQKNTSIILGGRLDDYSSFGETVNPRLGIIYSPEIITLKLLYGSAFRAPTYFELYYHDGYYTIEPNPDLENETLTTYEFVLEKEFKNNINASLSFYQISLENLISQVVTEDISPDSGEFLLQNQNVGEATVQGTELIVRGRVKSFRWKVGGNFQKSEDKISGDELPNSPQISGNFSLIIPLFNEKLFCNLDSEYIGKRLTTIPDIYLDPYYRADLILFTDKLVPNMEFTVKVNNLLDTEYSDVCSTEFVQTSIPQDGQRFLLKVAYKF